MARNRARVLLELVARNLVTPAVNAAKRDLKGLWQSATSLKGAIVGAMGSLGVGLTLNKAFAEADALNKAFLRLSGTAKLTGVALADLDEAAKRFQSRFNLSAQVANDFTAEVGRLAAKAGDVSNMEDVMAGFLNLAASRGYSAEEGLLAVRQAILGIDEGTDKLFGVNPSTLWKEYADSIGTSVGALTDQQKAQALVFATLRDSQKVGNAYIDFLKTGAGSSANFAKESGEAWAALGDLLEPLRVVVNNTFAGIAEGFTWFINGLETTLTGAVVLVDAFIDYFKWFGSAYIGTIGEVAAAFLSVFDKDLGDKLTERIRAWRARIRQESQASLAANRNILDIIRGENAGNRDTGGGGTKPGEETPAQRTARLKAEAEAAQKAHEEAIDRAVERAKLAEEAMALERFRMRGIVESREAERLLLEQLAKSNLALGERIKLTQTLESLRASRGAAENVFGADTAGLRDPAARRRMGEQAAAATAADFARRSAQGTGPLPTFAGTAGAAGNGNGLGANILINLDEQIAATREGISSLNGMLYDVSMDGVAAFRDAFVNTFAAIVDGSQSAGEALGNVALTFLSGTAKKMGDYFMAQSIASFASVFAPIPNPGGAKAGAGYLAGAAAMYALAGAGQGAAGRASGGGGFSRSDGFRDNLALPGNKPGDAVISIEGGILDMSDYRQREAMRAALESLSGRRVIIRGAGA